MNNTSNPYQYVPSKTANSNPTHNPYKTSSSTTYMNGPIQQVKKMQIRRNTPPRQTLRSANNHHHNNQHQQNHPQVFNKSSFNNQVRQLENQHPQQQQQPQQQQNGHGRKQLQHGQKQQGPQMGPQGPKTVQQGQPIRNQAENQTGMQPRPSRQYFRPNKRRNPESQSFDERSGQQKRSSPSESSMQRQQLALKSERQNSSGRTPSFGCRSFGLERQSYISEKLNTRLNRNDLKQRKGPGGQRLTYIEGWRAVSLANNIFGFNGWSSEIMKIDIISCERTEGRNTGGRGTWEVCACAMVRVTLQDGTYHDDVGLSTANNSKKSAALEQSQKAAVTDAIKRALRLFGDALGNSVYNREHLTEVNRNFNSRARVDNDTSLLETSFTLSKAA
eukprot:g1586.t1